MKLSKKQIWSGMNQQTKDFITAMIKQGLTISRIKKSAGIYVKIGTRDT